MNVNEYALRLHVEGKAIDGDTFDHASDISTEGSVLVRRNTSFTFTWTGIGTDHPHLRVSKSLSSGMFDLRELVLHIEVEVGTMFQRPFEIQPIFTISHNVLNVDVRMR